MYPYFLLFSDYFLCFFGLARKSRQREIQRVIDYYVPSISVRAPERSDPNYYQKNNKAIKELQRRYLLQKQYLQMLEEYHKERGR